MNNRTKPAGLTAAALFVICAVFSKALVLVNGRFI